MRSDGQGWAAEQLQDIAIASAGSFEVLDFTEPVSEGADLVVTVSVGCANFPKVEGGIPLRTRERLRINIPSRFPLRRPAVHFTHKRYAGFAHVQWGDYICLYQAPEVEWVPGQGMFGLMERVDEWLRAAAANELDPMGMPLHPPIAYTVSDYSIVPRVDTPDPEDQVWIGFAEITRDSDLVAELGNWFHYSDNNRPARLASAVLLPATMPSEYPETVYDLIVALLHRGLTVEIIHAIVNLGVLSAPAGKPTIFILGAAMRGIAGEKACQHLAAWVVDPQQSQKLRDAAIGKVEEKNDIDAFYSWAASAKVEWCQVLEDRPEIVVRRDAESPSAFWQSKQVALLGCGAIGSTIAPMLARAGISRLELYDSGIVRPGILVRQDFRRDDIGYTKCSALRVRLLGYRPDLNVTAHRRDILRVIDDEEAMKTLLGVDIIVDATASRSISTALEKHFRKVGTHHPPVISMAIGHNADFGMMTLVRESHAGMSLDADRRTKLALSDTARGQAYLDEYWPIDAARRMPFQPEPGCSSPTFRGSLADVLNLTSRMTNVAASWLAANASAPRAFAMDLSGGGLATGPDREVGFQWRPYTVIPDGNHGYQVRITSEAMASVLWWRNRSARVRGADVETGGPLFGELDELLKVIWIDEVGGPPPDSIASPHGFICGTEGLVAMNAEKVRRTRGSVSFVGMWHTHPGGVPVPSTTDLSAMQQLLGKGSDFLGRRFLMMIIGGTRKNPLVTATVFQRSDYGG